MWMSGISGMDQGEQVQIYRDWVWGMNEKQESMMSPYFLTGGC